MRNVVHIIGICIGVLCQPVWAQENSAAFFVKNEGQWAGDFNYKLRLNSGAVFFEDNGYSIQLTNGSEKYHGHGHDHTKGKSAPDLYKAHVLKIKFLFANPFPVVEGRETSSFYHNYFIGNDPSRWKSEVPVYHDLSYTDLYPGIDLRFTGRGGNLKYDMILAPGADPRLIHMQYRGAETMRVVNDRLFIGTSLGELQELIPEAYQMVNGSKQQVSCHYQLQGTTVKFVVGDYDPAYALVIDPELVFSSFSGSSADNWGFTATYDQAGHLYAGGVVFNDGGQYPITAGAFQSIFQGGLMDVDIGISKFSGSGDLLLYSTFIGGNGNDLPHSLVVDDKDQLYILGNTGSSDYPVTNQAYQTQFAGGPKVSIRAFSFNSGSDIIVSKLNADGSVLAASTFIGADQTDGINIGIFRNYGDNSRGEIISDNSNIYFISNTLSSDISLPNALHDTLIGQQDALVISMPDDLSTIRWGTYFGGTSSDAGYSIKADQLGHIIIGGATFSQDISTTGSSHKNQLQGDIDGFIASFNRDNGSFINSTYIGTANRDQVFLLDIDKNNSVYCFGQTNGTMTQSPGKYGTPGAWQFIKKFNNALTQETWSTTIGSGQPKSDIVPTAFLVDDCFNIFLSGWNGLSNQLTNGGVPQGNTNGLPVTTDAEKQTTDGSDFYFMVLSRNAEDLIYASYFGGTANEHVDGGTSRFDPRGTIYQAVCAGCSGESFPTTPGVVSEINGGNNCNLGVIKLDFEISVRARPEVDLEADTDTVCDTLYVKFSNASINADEYLWDFGNGLFSTLEEPETYFADLGVYEVRLIALDTNCGISDTSFITLVHDSVTGITPAFETDYTGCDTEFRARFRNLTPEADRFSWNFGDGLTSSLAEPVHFYPDTGSYIVTFTAIDSKCNRSYSITDTLTFRDTSVVPEPQADISLCGDGSVDIVLKNDRRRYDYFWKFGNGESSDVRYPNYRYQEPGFYTITVDITDSLCNKEFSVEYPVLIKEIISEVFIPNAFSPNGDGLNETLEIFGNKCTGSSEIVIFNRWGEKVFQSDEPFKEFWDANANGTPAPMGIYTYYLRNGKEEYRGTITLFR